MTFFGRERLGGSPRECYTFQRGLRAWRYTSSRAPLTLSGIHFVPANLKRGPFRRDEETGAQRLVVEIGRATDLAQRLIAVDFEPLTLVITRTHQEDDGSISYATPFRGEARAVVVHRERVEVTFVSVEALLERPFPSKVITKECQNAVYDERCGAYRPLFTRSVTITEFSGASVNDDLFGVDGWMVHLPTIKLTFDDGYVPSDGEYTGALLRVASGVDVFITRHVGEHYAYNGILPEGVAVGQPAAISYGCDKTIAMCYHRFNNVRNFLGFPWLPQVNPFTERID